MGHDGTSPHARQPWSARAILHVDLDAFFAAAEQLDHPEWRGLPVIVGGSPEGRGVVSTASYEARRYGIRSAMPAARAARLAPAHAIWARPRFERYSELSRRVFEILGDVTPHVQPLSIDEAFLDVTPGPHGSHPVLLAEEIRSRVAETGLTCSVGIATSKAVAKIASDHDKPDGLTVVWPGGERAFLDPLPIEVMSGIGPKTASRLNGFGVHLLGDLAALDNLTATELAGSHGPELVRRARGIDPREVHPRDPVRSVSNERTFAEDLRDAADVERVIGGLASKVASRLRRKGLAGRTVFVKVRFSDFTTRSAQRTLDGPTDTEDAIGTVARTLVHSLWNVGVGVRLLGVGVSALETPTRQLGLFDDDDTTRPAAGPARDALRPVDPERARAIAKSLDTVRERFGDEALRRGAGDLRSGRTTSRDVSSDKAGPTPDRGDKR